MSIFWRMRASLSLSPMACIGRLLWRTAGALPDSWAGLFSPPAGLHLGVLARRLPRVGRTEYDVLEPIRPRLEASPHAGSHANRVEQLHVTDVVVHLHPAAAAHHDVDLLLRLVGMAEREAEVRREPLVAQAGLLELEALPREAGLEVRRSPEPLRGVRDVLFEVRDRVAGHAPSLVRPPIALTLDVVARRVA